MATVLLARAEKVLADQFATTAQPTNLPIRIHSARHVTLHV